MSTEQLHLTAPDPRLHSDALIDLVAKTFSGDGGYYTLRDACRRIYIQHSHYDWQASRIGLLGDLIVSHYGVWRYDMRIGAARVRAGGIGAVATDPEYRKKGLMNRTARASLDAMHMCGYDLTILFGIDDFYHKYGYVRAWADTNYIVRVVHLPKDPPRFPVQRTKPHPRADLAALYNAYYADATGTAVRPTFLRGHSSWLGNTERYVWNVEGKPAGYVALTRNGNQLRCIEYVGDVEQTLRVLGKLGRKWGCEQIHFTTIPHRSELVTCLKRGTCRTETHYRRCGGAMVCLINLPAALTKMQAELSHRLRASHLAKWRGKLLIADTQEQALLKIQQGQVTVAPAAASAHMIRGGDAIVQLLIGTDTPSEVMAAQRITATGEAAALAEVLFPAQHPQLSQLDRY